jgi:hypothetical protein
MKGRGDRRAFLRCLAAGAASISLPRFVAAQEGKAGKKTYTYKTVGKCEIKADVYGAVDTVRPAVLWVHGERSSWATGEGSTRPSWTSS